MDMRPDDLMLMTPRTMSYAPGGEAATRMEAEARRDAGRHLGERFARAVKWVRELPHRNAVRAELSALSDRDLADIGLSRSEIPMVFNRSFANARARRASMVP
jgi:uncharacterized protein YjiS (DUF1127 family)